jgi:L-rhamnose-H+ transport protein
MASEQILGFGLMLIGAICGGSFGLPSKYAKEGTPWEVLWGPFFFFVAVLIPVVVAPLVVQDLGGIYSQVGMGTILAVLVFGFLWGLGSMTLGMSFAFIGLSLAYALNYGAQIVFGSMMPMVLFSPDEILTPHGYVILSGVAVCLAGVVVCGRAGILKERSLAKEPDQTEQATDSKQPKMMVGLIIGVVSGILCACYAVASAYAGPVGATAVDVGNPPWAAAWAVTALILWGGAVSSCLYCAVQLTRNKTWGHLSQAGARRVLLLAAIMAVLHDAAIFFFGLGWINLGDLGISVGYPVFMSFAIIVGNVHGFRTGEWKGASRQSVTWIVVGIAILIIGVCLLAQGKAMMPG